MSKKDYIENIDNAERRYLTAPVGTKKRAAEDENDTDKIVIEGYGAKFNSRTELWPGVYEEILPGFFDEVLGNDVRCLINHDPNYIVARSVDGVGTLELFVDEIGLGYRYTTPDISYALDLQTNIELKNITQSSFSFIPSEVTWVSLEGGSELRQLKKCEILFDVSPVTFPAYADTSVAKRGFDALEKKPEFKSKFDEFEARQRYINLKK